MKGKLGEALSMLVAEGLSASGGFYTPGTQNHIVADDVFPGPAQGSSEVKRSSQLRESTNLYTDPLLHWILP
ncbi:hypothetical protein KJ564_00235 [bacterium]|nr:hypothetical protein [bacterium]MBU1882589.1 hypothetical protein [bacterium]